MLGQIERFCSLDRLSRSAFSSPPPPFFFFLLCSAVCASHHFLVHYPVSLFNDFLFPFRLTALFASLSLPSSPFTPLIRFPLVTPRCPRSSPSRFRPSFPSFPFASLPRFFLSILQCKIKTIPTPVFRGTVDDLRGPEFATSLSTSHNGRGGRWGRIKTVVRPECFRAGRWQSGPLPAHRCNNTSTNPAWNCKRTFYCGVG